MRFLNMLSFTYQSEQQMRAWTRHDSRYPVEQVVGTDIPNVSFYVTNKDGQRYIERSLPRYIPISDYETDPEWYMSAPTAFMDAIATGKAFVDFAFIGDFELTPVTPDVWDGPLTLTGSGAFQAGWVGTQRFRWFHPVDRTRIDFDITAYTSTSEVTVQPSEEFPSEYAVNPRLYRLRNFVVGLAHLEGEQVSVVVDGDVVSSPNDVNGISYFTVTGGVLELPEEIEGGIIHVGRPIIADVKTLNMSTIEQSPTLIESLTVNKMYIKIFESLGMYVGNKFPDGVDGLSVVGMEDLEKRYVPEDEPLLGNKPTDPVTKRIELTMVGAWDTQGEICIRQVDPRHFEIMSIIPDVTVEKRSDR